MIWILTKYHYLDVIWGDKLKGSKHLILRWTSSVGQFGVSFVDELDKLLTLGGIEEGGHKVHPSRWNQSGYVGGRFDRVLIVVIITVTRQEAKVVVSHG